MASPTGQQPRQFKAGDVITHGFLNQVIAGLARRVIGGGGNRVRRLGQNILIDHDDKFLTKTVSELTQDWFWARLTALPTILSSTGLTSSPDLNDQSIGNSRFGLGLEEVGYKFSYAFEEVQLIGTRTYFDDVINIWKTEPPKAATLQNGRTGKAINTTEIQHRSLGGGDDEQPWVVWGVNIMGTYYPPDFRPIPPGCFFDITTNEPNGRTYRPLSAIGGKQVMPVVRMREFMDQGEVVYNFHQMGSHDGGCAPVIEE